MKLHEFRTIDINFESNPEKFPHWSRAYEYPLVLNLLEKYGANKDSKIHNTAWGFEGVHITFKNILDEQYKNNINSDLRPSLEPNTYVYNLLDTPKQEWLDTFDFVLNISTLEEVMNADHVDIFHKSFSMVKKEERGGGMFIVTFDLINPYSQENTNFNYLQGIQLNKFEKLFNTKFQFGENPISGINTTGHKEKRWENLLCGYMVIEK